MPGRGLQTLSSHGTSYRCWMPMCVQRVVWRCGGRIYAKRWRTAWTNLSTWPLDWKHNSTRFFFQVIPLHSTFCHPGVAFLSSGGSPHDFNNQRVNQQILSLDCKRYLLLLFFFLTFIIWAFKKLLKMALYDGKCFSPVLTNFCNIDRSIMLINLYLYW